MDINSKFIYAKSREAFERELPNIPPGLNPIVFIESTKEMWTMGTYFSIGYPGIEITEGTNDVTVNIGDSNFSLSTRGDSLSVKKSTTGNGIILSSTALTKVDTEAPLDWDIVNEKLLHLKSGVTPNYYGQSTSSESASIFSIPYFSVDSYGHITNAKSVNIQIRDYVTQLTPSDILADRNVLLGNGDTTNQASETGQVRKANGLTYNDNSGQLNVKGGINAGGGVNVTNGDLTVVGGQIVGDLKGNVTGSATPKIHLSSEPEYGGASTELYGHVKVQDTLGVTAPSPSSTETDPTSSTILKGIAASPLMVWNVREELNDKIDALPGIGIIATDSGSISITEHNQTLTINASQGITVGITETGIELKGIEISGYNSNENEVVVSDNLTFSKDFVVNGDNSVLLRWTEL